MIISADICATFSDQALVIKSLQEVDYFGCLYQRYEDRLTRYIQRISGSDADEALDILQDVFIKAWRRLNDYDQQLPFSSWLYRIAHNVTINSWKQSHRRIKHEQAIQAEDMENWHDVLSEAESGQQTIAWLNAGLDALDEKYRHVLILHYLEDKNYRDISDILKIPMGTVAVRINRGKQTMKTWIMDHQKQTR